MEYLDRIVILFFGEFYCVQFWAHSGRRQSEFRQQVVEGGLLMKVKMTRPKHRKHKRPNAEK